MNERTGPLRRTCSCAARPVHGSTAAGLSLSSSTIPTHLVLGPGEPRSVPFTLFLRPGYLYLLLGLLLQLPLNKMEQAEAQEARGHEAAEKLKARDLPLMFLRRLERGDVAALLPRVATGV